MNFIDWLATSGLVLTANDSNLPEVDKTSPRDKILLERFLAHDADEEEHWITTRENHRVLLDEEGEIKQGFGGKFDGQKISSVGGVNDKPAPFKTASIDEIKSQIVDFSEMPMFETATNSYGDIIESPEEKQWFHEQNTLRSELKEAEWNEEYKNDPKGKEFSDRPEDPTAAELKDSLPQGWGKDHGQEFVDSVVAYTGGDWDDWKYDATIDYGIRNSSLKWDKGTLYRGVRVHPDELEALRNGKYYVGKGLESWSTSQDVARDFTNGLKEDQSRVILIDKTKGERNAVPIAGISEMPEEKEVLYAINQGFKINSVKDGKMTIPARYGSPEKEVEVTFVELESL